MSDLTRPAPSQNGSAHAKPSRDHHYKASSKRLPCPICGRTKDSDCRISDDLILCAYGSTHHPPENLRPGDTCKAHDGTVWAFTGNDSTERWAIFKLDRPLNSAIKLPSPAKSSVDRFAGLPEAQPEPPAKWPNGQKLYYSGSQWIAVGARENEKSAYRPWHLDESGEARIGRGDSDWPLFHQEEAVALGSGKWITEAEGEKCTEWIRAGGFVAVSQPGFDHCEEGIRSRYLTLKNAGIVGIRYLADNDKTGKIKGERCAAVAASVGLGFQLIDAFDIWPDIPQKGSIDDASGSAKERTEAFVKFTPSASKSSGNGFSPSATSSAKWGKRRIGNTKAMRCFDRCVEVLAKRERNSLTRRVRLLRAAKALDLHQYINRQEISQRVLQAKDEQQGNGYQGLTAEQRLAMEWPEVKWLVPNLLPANDLSIIGGRPKVGKTAFTMSVAAAMLTGSEVAGCPRPDEMRPVIVISDDAGDADTHQALKNLEIFDHPNLIWSRHFRLTETDIDRLLIDIEQNPGAVVILDSLRSVARHLEKGENDPEIGAVIYDLKEAVISVGGSLILVHHCNKADGLAGIEALSGHNAISGAANTVITLHHVTDAEGRPNKEAEQRRLYREGRSGQMLDWVISRTAGTGTFHYVSTWSSWQEQAKEAQAEARRESRTTGEQRDVLGLLEGRQGDWLTCREVVEELGLEWGTTGAGKDANRVRDALKRLAADQRIQATRAGTAYVYSSIWPGHYEPQKPQIPQKPVIAMDLGSESKPQKPQKPQKPFVSAPSSDGRTLPSEVSEIEPQKPNPLQRNASEPSEVSEAMWIGGATAGTSWHRETTTEGSTM